MFALSLYQPRISAASRPFKILAQYFRCFRVVLLIRILRSFSHTQDRYTHDFSILAFDPQLLLRFTEATRYGKLFRFLIQWKNNKKKVKTRCHVTHEHVRRLGSTGAPIRSRVPLPHPISNAIGAQVRIPLMLNRRSKSNHPILRPTSIGVRHTESCIVL